MPDWTSMHIWYHDIQRQDELLQDLVLPLKESLVRGDLIDRYFFIRYWAGGPHIRLRVLPREGTGAECRSRLETAVSSYLTERPSSPPPDAMSWGNRGSPPMPDNTWQLVPYEPELERYGGPEGVRIAEAHFMCSSDLALEVIQRARGLQDPFGAKLGYALQLASVLVLSAGFRGQLTYRFFEDCLQHVYLDEFSVDDYADVFRRLRPHLLDTFVRLEALDVDWALAGDPALQAWGRSSTDLCAELADHIGSGPADWRRPLSRVGNAKMKYVRIIHSYLHMFLNRVGFWGRQEERVLRLCRDAWQGVTLA